MPQDIDFAGLIGPVALRLCGEPNKRLSSKTELRFGKNGSLSVDLEKGTAYDHEEKTGGGTLWLIAHRRGGDANGAATDWLKAEGFYRPGDPIRPEPSPKAKIVATFDYVDEFGEFLFQVVRFEPKDFRQRRKPRPDDDPDRIKNGWVWSVKGCRQVPYRLPELVEAISNGNTIFVAEGEKKADRLWSLGIPATCNAMGAGKWHDDLIPTFAGADVVILPDNDPQATQKDGTLRFHEDGRPVYTGRDHAALVAARLQGVASRVRILSLGGVPQPPDAGPLLPPKGDIIEWTDAGGTVEKLWALVEKIGEAQVEPFRSKFNAVWFADIDRDPPRRDWVVKGLFGVRELGVLWGFSGCGKSFLGIDMGLHVAETAVIKRDEPRWFGHRIYPGGVVYCAPEGGTDLLLRMRAWRMHRGLDPGMPLPFVLLPTSIDLVNAEGDTSRLIDEIKAHASRMGVPLSMVIVDTLSRAMGGRDENTGADMGTFIKNCERIQRETLTYVLPIHHAGNDRTKERGHTSLRAAVDTSIETVKPDDGGPNTFILRKMKGGPEGIQHQFRLRQVVLGQDADGDDITSCVIVPHDEEQASPLHGDVKKGPHLSDQQRIALTALREALIDHGEPAPGSLQLGHDARVVHARFWKQEFLRRGFTEEPPESTFRTAFKRVGEAMIARRIIGTSQPYVWIVRDPSK